MISQRSILFFLLALALIRGFIYAFAVPPWQAPDEPAQFERARAAVTAAEWNSTAENGPDWYRDLSQSLFTFGFWDFLPEARPTFSPDALLNQHIVLYHEAYQGTYSSRFPYAVIGWPLFLNSAQDISLQLYFVRLNTVLMNVGIVLFAFLLTRTIFPNDSFLVLGVPTIILFNPQHTYLLSTVNNGNLAELLTLVALYFIVKGVIKGFSWLIVLAVVIFSLLAIWTKATAFFLPFVLATLGLFFLWQYRRYWRWLIPAGAVLAVGIYLFSPGRLKLLMNSAWQMLSAGNIYLDPYVPRILFRSFWALPGWLTLNLHPFWYQLLVIGCLLAGVGLVLLLVTKRHLIFSKQRQPQIQALIILAVAIVVSIGILLGWNAIANVITYRQGRSIYPVIVPISIFLMLGWRQLIPVNWRSFGLVAITLVFFLFDTLVLFHYLIPFFYSRY